MRSRRESGNAIVEFALIMPFMLMIVLGVTELGRYAYYSIAVANAAKAGAAYGGSSSQNAEDQAGMVSAAQQDYNLNGIGTITNPTPDATFYCTNWNYSSQTMSAPTPCAAAASGTNTLPVYYVSVQVQATIKPLFHYPLLPSTITVSSTAIQQVSQR